MEPQKPATEADKPKDESAPPETTQSAPQDALGKTNEELHEEAVNNTGSIDGGSAPGDQPVKKPGGFKAFMHKVDIYLLGFLLIVVLVAATGVVSYLNSKKVPKTAATASQPLTQDALKQLANSSATVGNATQTLTVQGNTILAGQVLAQRDLSVAGNLRLGGNIDTSALTVSGKTNLADAQINSLQVASTTALTGATTTGALTVAGVASFSAPVTASQITVTSLILSGNALLQIPNHLAFTGPPPGRSISAGVLGAGGSASINGSDTSGTVNINSGNNPTVGCFVDITFNQAFKTVPRIIVSPFGAAAGVTEFYVKKSLTGFSICGNAAAPANQVFGFDYFIAA